MTAIEPELGGYGEPGAEADALAAAYRLTADCFLYPEELDRERFVEDAREDVLPGVETHVDAAAAAHLGRFLDEFGSISTDEYVRTLELSPTCPLYLGHYEFDAPKTCREISNNDRNQYMVELAAIYEHFGFELADELPDYLPAMVEFLWLTRSERGDELRAEFASKMASILPGMIEQFEEAGTPYRLPLRALKRVVEYDLEAPEGGDG